MGRKLGSHNKTKKEKVLQKEIQPQVPKIKPPKKINDPEGLGKIIPKKMLLL